MYHLSLDKPSHMPYIRNVEGKVSLGLSFLSTPIPYLPKPMSAQLNDFPNTDTDKTVANDRGYLIDILADMEESHTHALELIKKARIQVLQLNFEKNTFPEVFNDSEFSKTLRLLNHEKEEIENDIGLIKELEE